MRKLILPGFLCLGMSLSAQFFDDFSNGQLEWQGDTGHFVINSEEQLQLNSMGAGEVLIWRKVQQMDTMVWQGHVVLDFAPSSSNQVEIWLVSDSLSMKNGLMFRLGESGSQDSLRIEEVVNGTKGQVLAIGSEGFTGDHVDFNFKLEKENNGLHFKLFTLLDSSEVRIGFDVERYRPFYFIIKCKFTSTRADRFYFDDIGAGLVPEDTIPPVIEEIVVIDSQSLIVYFTEPLMNSAGTRVLLNPALGHVSVNEDHDRGIWHIGMEEPMKSGEEYTLSIENVIDVSGNRTARSDIKFRFIRISDPNQFDLVISEIMADPSPARALPPCEYVELYNRSGKFFNLADLTIADGGSQAFLPDSVIAPNEYVILCDDGCIGQMDDFGRVIPVKGLPNFNNDGDEVRIVDLSGRIIHGISYDRNWYRDPGRSEGGWSLEMIHPGDICKGASNWAAADRELCGSPGKPNTVSPDEFIPTALALERARALGDDVLQLHFDREIASPDPRELRFSPVLQVTDIRSDGAQCLVYFADDLIAGQRYEFSVGGIPDCEGEVHEGPFSGEFYLPRRPDSGEVIVNEVLFDPTTGADDFVELRNVSEDYLKIPRPCIEVRTSGDTSFVCLDEDLVMAPGEHLAFSRDTAALATQYDCGPRVFFDLPNLPVDGAKIVLFHYLFGQRRILDDADYREAWHSPVLEETKGVSLERMRSNGRGDDRHNWHSASSVDGFATPGRMNSVERSAMGDEEEVMSLPWDVFSPNNDGHRDWVEVHVRPDRPGYQLRLEVFDLKGRYLKNLAANALVGDRGVFIWNGADDNGTLQPFGVYLILAEMAHPDGDLIREKQTVVIN